MLLWFLNNIGTIITAVITLAVIGIVIAVMVRDKRKGRTSCGCGCSGCAMREECHSKK